MLEACLFLPYLVFMAVPQRARGLIVKAIRESLDRPANRTAEAAGGLDKGYYSMIESGKRTPSREVTRRLADALGVPAEVLSGQIPAIQAIREAQGITPQQFARDIGITTGRLARLEQGSELPDPALTSVIAQRLGVAPSVVRPLADEEEA